MAQAEELVYNLVFDFQTKMFKTFENSISQVSRALLKMGTVAGASAGFMAKRAQDTARETMLMKNLAGQLNITTDAYQKLKLVTGGKGITEGSMTSSLASLSRARENALLGSGDFMAWGQLGIDPLKEKNPEKLFLKIADSISKIKDNSRAINIMERLGISADMLPLLRQGSKEIQKLGNFYEEVGATLSKQDVAIADKFTDVSTKVKAIYEGLMNKIGTQFQKYFIPILEQFSNWWRANSKTINKVIKTIIKIMQTFWDVAGAVFSRLAATAGNFTQMMGGLKNTLYAVGIAYLVMSRRAIMAYTRTLAPALLLYLAVDDLLKLWNDPKNSMIGNLFEIDENKFKGIFSLKQLLENIETIIHNIKVMWEYLLLGFNKVKNFVVNTGGEQFTKVGGAREERGKWFVEVMQGIAESIKGAPPAIIKVFVDGVQTNARKQMANRGDQ